MIAAHRSKSYDPKVAAMKLVIAIIQPTKLEAVRQALNKIEVTRMTVCDAQGYGRQRGRTEMYRGHEYKTHLLRKIALEIIVNDDFLDRTIETSAWQSPAPVPKAKSATARFLCLPAVEAISLAGSMRGPRSGLNLSAEPATCITSMLDRLFLTTDFVFPSRVAGVAQQLGARLETAAIGRSVVTRTRREQFERLPSCCSI